MIFSTVFGPQEPALTVGSFAMIATGRPAIVPRPVTTPSAPKPSSSQLARSASSANDSGSSRRATRSRTGLFPCCSDFSWGRVGPPAPPRGHLPVLLRLLVVAGGPAGERRLERVLKLRHAPESAIRFQNRTSA